MSKPNETLGALIAEAGFSWAGLARRINDLGANDGPTLRYDYTAVHRWVRKGERPRPPVPNLVAQALSERLGRRVLPTDIGMPDDETLATRGLRYGDSPDRTVATIVELGRADIARRRLMASPFVLAALAAPSRDWLLATLEAAATDRGPRRIGMRQVAGLRDTFALFQEMDVLRGGGHARTALVEYLNAAVLPLLRREHEPLVRRALYEAAAEHAYLVGWMAYDDGRHGLAQRYLIQALHLAEESGNAAIGAHVLAGLSDQANLLGHPREALMLARAGRRGAASAGSAACLADLHILEARALAALGEAGAAARQVALAERSFGRIVRTDEPEWARFIDEPYLFGEAAHCFRDLGQPEQTERFARDSIAGAHRQGRARRGALSHAALARADLARGDVAAAAERGLRVVDLAATVDSTRCRATVRDLQRRLRPHARIPEVRRLNARAAELLGVAA